MQIYNVLISRMLLSRNQKKISLFYLLLQGVAFFIFHCVLDDQVIN